LVSAVSISVLVMVIDAQAASASTPSPDYGPPAVWISANANNFTVADRPRDYPVDMIVIHDIEGSYSSAISTFQDPDRAASAHYVIGDDGQIAQMVREKDIAWHAGNWDYNTRAIGIEHEGYAWTPNTYTIPEYTASAHLIASICSRWGVPMDRQHVIGHYQVPDPNHPGLFGGTDHHTDPGPYWNWSYYMGLAVADAKNLPSPPHMELNPVALYGDRSVALSWPAARTCHNPIDHYEIVEQPDDITTTVPGNVTSRTITGLTNGKTYMFTVTAVNSDGTDTAISNHVVPMRRPYAPTTAQAIPAGGSAVVSWTPPSDNGGSWITGYVVTPYLNGVTPESAVWFNQRNTMEVVLNLKNNSTYTFTVQAVNAAGIGDASSSNSVTPRSIWREPPAQVAPAPPSGGSGSTQSSPIPSPPPR
jgi:hypothetical protein